MRSARRRTTSAGRGPAKTRRPRPDGVDLDAPRVVALARARKRLVSVLSSSTPKPARREQPRHREVRRVVAEADAPRRDERADDLALPSLVGALPDVALDLVAALVDRRSSARRSRGAARPQAPRSRSRMPLARRRARLQRDHALRVGEEPHVRSSGRAGRRWRASRAAPAPRARTLATRVAPCHAPSASRNASGRAGWPPSGAERDARRGRRRASRPAAPASTRSCAAAGAARARTSVAARSEPAPHSAPQARCARPRRPRAVDQVADLVARLLPLAEDVRGDDVGVGRVGPADADAHAREAGVAELALAATSGRCGRRGRRRRACGSRRTAGRSRRAGRGRGRGPRRGTRRAPGPTERPASFMYVCGSSTATRGPPGPVAPSVTQAVELLLRRGRSQRRASASATSKPTLCGVPA